MKADDLMILTAPVALVVLKLSILPLAAVLLAGSVAKTAFAPSSPQLQPAPAARLAKIKAI